MMAEKNQPSPPASQVMDNFKLVDGIGPAVEKRLHAAGIRTYVELSRMETDRLAEIVDGMIGYSVKRIKEQDWSGQARVLAEQSEKHFPEETRAPANNGLHYASYTLELLLDHENHVHSMRAMHVQTRQEARWAGWDPDRLQNFLIGSGKLQITMPRGAAPMAAPMKEAPVSEQASPSPETLESPKLAAKLQGVTEIVETRLVNQSRQPIGILIPGNTPFGVELELDLSRVEVPQGEQLSYDAIIYMKRLGKSGMDMIGRKEGTIPADQSVMINVSSQPLDPGDYHMEALVSLRPQSQPKRLKNQMAAMTESMVLHVF